MRYSAHVNTKMVTDYLDHTVAIYPDKVAFADRNKNITFQSFRNNALELATHIIRRGYFKKPIAIYLNKSIECLYSFMGVLYSGNFYTPLDIEMPIDRIKKICETLQPALIITDVEHGNDLKEMALPLLFLEDIDRAIDEDSIDSVRRRVIDTDTAYVLFTSGSTGIPKGVVINHRNIITYMEWSTEAFHFDDKTVFGNQTPFYFSMSVLDIYQTMRSGATLVIIPKPLFSFPVRLLEFMDDNDVNTIYWVPSALCQVANLKALNSGRGLNKLHTVLFAGEVMPAKQLNMWRRAIPGALFANLFGPTEVTDICTYYKVERELLDTEPVPIGKVCDNMSIMIVKEDGKEAKQGEVGEMLVRGSSLAEGYYNSPEKTTEAFIQNPLNSAFPEPVYKTGDLVYVNEMDELIYVSRKDFQIKHMGYRIELGEIETAASAVDGITRVCCVYDNDKSEIVLYFTGNVDAKNVKKSLRERIPKYMIPSRYKKLNDMPLNANGKIDRVFLAKQHLSGTAKTKELSADKNRSKASMGGSSKDARKPFEYSAKRTARMWDFIARQSDDEIVRGGWRNSYTGEPFTKQEMQEYADDVYLKLKDYLNEETTVLEIGCASGITMYRIAPYVKRYIGTDMATVNLEKNEEYNKSKRITNIDLLQCNANEIGDKISEKVDIVIINSVLQYFPTMEYLEDVIRQSILLLRSPGILYLGDIRDANKKAEFSESVKNYQMEQGTTTAEKKTREELMLTRDYCQGLVGKFQEIMEVDVTEKIGHIKNELTQYRFDAVCKVKHMGV